MTSSQSEDQYMSKKVFLQKHKISTFEMIRKSSWKISIKSDEKNCICDSIEIGLHKQMLMMTNSWSEKKLSSY